MKKTLLALVALWMGTMMPVWAQEESVARDSMVIEQPNRMVITTSGDTLTLTVEGMRDNPDFRYTRQAILAADEPVVVKEKKENWEFSIPFSRPVVTRTPYKGSRMRIRGFGIGFITALNAPEGMKLDMGRSIEFVSPSLEFVHYFGLPSRLNLSVGLQAVWRNYRMNGSLRFVERDEKVLLESYPEGAKVDFSRLRVTSLAIPLMVNFNIGKVWEVNLGPVVSFNGKGILKTKYVLDDVKCQEKTYDVGLNKLTADLFAHVSCRDIGIYVRYSPCDVLNTDYGPSFKGLSTGFTLWW